MNNDKINIMDLEIADSGPLKTLGVRIDKDIDKKLNNICLAIGVKKGIVIRRLLAYSLPKMVIDTVAVDSLEGEQTNSKLQFNFGDQFSFRITSEDYTKILNIKDKTNMNVNVIVNSCLAYSIDKVVVNRIRFN